MEQNHVNGLKEWVNYIVIFFHFSIKYTKESPQEKMDWLVGDKTPLHWEVDGMTQFHEPRNWPFNYKILFPSLFSIQWSKKVSPRKAKISIYFYFHVINLDHFANFKFNRRYLVREFLIRRETKTSHESNR